MPKYDCANPDAGMRLDKWLWCARFYKTRSLASNAIRCGRVLVNEIKPKPSKLITSGEHIRISKGPYRYDITVTALSASRKSAADTCLLFTESAESVMERETTAARLKIEAMASPRTKGRPTKRERRALLGFKNRI